MTVLQTIQEPRNPRGTCKVLRGPNHAVPAGPRSGTDVLEWFSKVKVAEVRPNMNSQQSVNFDSAIELAEDLKRFK